MKYIKKIGIILLALILLLSFIFLFRERENSSTKKGLSYLEKQEDKSIEPIEKKIRSQLKTRLMEASESGDGSIWAYFSDTVLMGDSRVYEFKGCSFLPERQVLAEKGDTIRKIEEHTDELKVLNPENLVLSYGLNDVSIGYWNDEKEYVEEYIEIIKKLKELLPDTNIYVNSILPATEAGIAREGSWANIPTFNKALKKMCNDLNIGYIDATNLASQNENLYFDDGVHVSVPFYPQWAALIMSTIYG